METTTITTIFLSLVAQCPSLSHRESFHSVGLSEEEEEEEEK